MPAERQRQVCAPAIAAGLAIVLFASARATWAGAGAHGRDYSDQMALREAALGLHGLAKDDMVLVDWPHLRKSHLYVKYWSAVDSLEVDDRHPVASRVAQSRSARHVYLLSRTPVGSDAVLVSGHGYLYKLR